ncbi:MAG: hypothetical protein IIA61_02530 [Candidatus Marinimicrobia bacterium]|nr:hypothetical protein [Candidatus Neomarinimicrobiota bacterium]
MTPLQSTVIGISFWVLSLFQVIVMAWMWKYNDPAKHTSEPHHDEADPWRTTLRKWVVTHRVVGLLYVILYIFMMSRMVPRMWTYQVELPARTVAHLTIGFSIGIVLLSKISIIRFFRHLSYVLPVFGFFLFFLTTILLGLSVPFVYQEHKLMATMRAFSDENMKRIERLLPRAGYSQEEAHRLATVDVVKAGRGVLLQKCVQCHDLRTILVKPRTPKGWVNVVRRMVAMPTIGFPILEEDKDLVVTYLVGITPDLQQSVKEKRTTQEVTVTASLKLRPSLADLPALDMARAKVVLEKTCTQCHELTEIDDHGGDSMEGWNSTVTRMVEENGLFEERDILETIILYLASTRPIEVSLNLE